jgi:hypothetical protein
MIVVNRAFGDLSIASKTASVTWDSLSMIMVGPRQGDGVTQSIVLSRYTQSIA